MSKTAPELPAASTPLDPADLLMVWQAAQGLSRVDVGDTGLAGVDIITNANGTAWRFPFGLQVCWLNVLLSSVAVDTASGNIFISAIQTWTFPAAFTEAPFAAGNRIGTEGGTSWISGVPAASPSTQWQFILNRATTQVAENRRIGLGAIGKWL